MTKRKGDLNLKAKSMFKPRSIINKLKKHFAP